LATVGVLAKHLKDFEQSREYMEAALEIAHELNDPNLMRDQANLANAFGDLGLLEEAERLHKASLEMAQESSDTWLVATQHHNLGWIFLQQGRLDEARQNFELCASSKREFGDQWGTALSLWNLSIVARRQGALDEAATLNEEAATLFHNAGFEGHRARAFRSLAQVVSEQGDPVGSWAHLRTALSIWVELGDREGAVEPLVEAAKLSAEQTDAVSAARFVRLVQALIDESGGSLDEEDRSTYEGFVERIRGVLDPESYAKELGVGRSMSLRNAIVVDVAGRRVFSIFLDGKVGNIWWDGRTLDDHRVAPDAVQAEPSTSEDERAPLPTVRCRAHPCVPFDTHHQPPPVARFPQINCLPRFSADLLDPSRLARPLLQGNGVGIAHSARDAGETPGAGPHAGKEFAS
jgi:hypothetical protein